MENQEPAEKFSTQAQQLADSLELSEKIHAQAKLFNEGAPIPPVNELVGKKLESILTPADREILPSGMDVRWKNRVAWQRLNMLKRGLLRNNSRRGIWEITEAGRKWVADANLQLSMLEVQKKTIALCRQSDPNCEVRVLKSDVPGHFRLKVMSGGIILIGPEFDISFSEFAKKSPEQLWDFLESISAHRIKRPRA